VTVLDFRPKDFVEFDSHSRHAPQPETASEMVSSAMIRGENG
jgi:hypothetical protein